MENATSQQLGALVLSLREQIEATQKALTAAYQREQCAMKLDRYRAAILSIGLDGVKQIEDMYEHTNLAKLMTMIDLAKLQESTPELSFTLTIDPIFE